MNRTLFISFDSERFAKIERNYVAAQIRLAVYENIYFTIYAQKERACKRHKEQTRQMN